MDLLGVRAAARELGVNASTISRQLAAGIIPNRGSAREPKVNLAEARAARDAHLDPSKRGNAAGRMLGEQPSNAATAEPAEVQEGDQGEGQSGAPDAAPDGLRTARTTREGYLAQIARLDYEKRAGILVSRDEVEQALMDVVRTIRDALLHLGDKLAVELVGMTDPLEISKAVNREHRHLLELLSTALRKKGEGGDG